MTRFGMVAIFGSVATIAFAVWATSGPSEAELRLVANVFEGVPISVLEVRRSIPFWGPPPQPCEYVLVELLPEASEKPPETLDRWNRGEWHQGPAKWYQANSNVNNDDLMLCGLNRFSGGRLEETLTMLSNDPATWWLDNGRGGYLYSKPKGLAFYFYLID